MRLDSECETDFVNLYFYNCSMFEYFEMYAGYLKHLIMMKAAITYLSKMSGTKIDRRHEGALKEMTASLEKIQEDVLSLQKCIQKV